MDRNLEGLTLNRDTWCSFEDENLFVTITKPRKADQEKWDAERSLNPKNLLDMLVPPFRHLPGCLVTVYIKSSYPIKFSAVHL